MDNGKVSALMARDATPPKAAVVRETWRVSAARRQGISDPGYTRIINSQKLKIKVKKKS
jgi:hypothetical protein